MGQKIKVNPVYVKPFCMLLLGLASLIVVALIGHHQQLTKRSGSGGHGGSDSSDRDRFRSGDYGNENERYLSRLLQREIRPENIRQHLRKLTSKPHPAGTRNQHAVADYIKEQWSIQGLENVHFAEYDVLLSHPADYDRPNTVELLDRNERSIYKCVGQQPPLIPDEQSDYGANVTFNAYSASGTVVGEPVYANYGRKDDYELLDLQNISLKGKIVIVRYGKLWRGKKVSEAQRRGAVGVVLYSDPADVSPNVTDDRDRYPNSIWMPSGGVQSGTLLNFDGDPLTPLYPSLNYTYRWNGMDDLLELGIIPKIPVQPISYGDAYQFLRRMAGSEVPREWRGELNLTYRFGPGILNGTGRIRLSVRANNTRGKIRNVIGFIEGRREPDRYVIAGNHFDAWSYGAIDPNSGTSVLLEVSRAFMRVINESGWKPLRTVVFCGKQAFP